MGLIVVVVAAFGLVVRIFVELGLVVVVQLGHRDRHHLPSWILQLDVLPRNLLREPYQS